VVIRERRHQDELYRQASHDNLTELLHRSAFESTLEQSLESARKRALEHILCFMDLDQFKVVNDTCGHVAGDELLRQIATIMRKEIQEHTFTWQGHDFRISLGIVQIDQNSESIRMLMSAEVVVKGIEILLRMKSPLDELIPTGAFLPSAEQYDLIERIDCYVIERVLRLLSESGNDYLDCLINISGMTLGRNELV
jgi:GGDEF domain-containing protein